MGFVTGRPDYVLNFTAGSDFLPLSILVAEAEGDTVMLIYTPEGRWEFNDDFEGVNAGIQFENPSSGSYKIWVGTYNDEFSVATLHITEYD